MEKIDIVQSGGSRGNSGTLEAYHRKQSAAAHHLTTIDVQKEAKHQVTKHRVAHRPQKTSTLHRNAVKKPDLKPPKSLIHQIQSPHLNKQLKVTRNGRLVPPDTEDRAQRAKKIPKSELVNRFTIEPSDEPLTITQTIEVKPQPVERFGDALYEEGMPEQRVTTNNPFDTAVERATSHIADPQRTQTKRVNRWKIRKLMALLTMLVILGGAYIGYHERARIALRYVGDKANFSVVQPRVLPKGYHLDPHIIYGFQTMTMKYVKGNDSFLLTEQATTFDQFSVGSQFVASSQQTYETRTINGQIIYLYGNNNAAWVQGNKLFILNNTANLSLDDVMTLVANF